MLMQMIVTRCDRPNRMRRVQGNGHAHIRDARGLHPSGDTQQGVGFRIRRLENETRAIPREMDDMSA
jgi:hypothetical protein